MIKQNVATGSGFEREVVDHFGLLPNLFRCAPFAPEISRQRWLFAKASYVEAPLPSLFKERLLVYLSRFCEARYCVIRHFGFLVGLGRPSGDPHVEPETIAQASELLFRPLVDPADIGLALSHLEAIAQPIDIPVPRSELEANLFDAIAVLFTSPTRNTERARFALRTVLGDTRMEILAALLGFIRTAHWWTEVHPELDVEADVAALMQDNPDLAARLLNTKESQSARQDDTLRQQIAVRVSSQVALRDSEARFQQFAAASSNVFWIRDAETLQLEYLSPAFETIFGASREQLLEKTGLSQWTELIVPDDRTRALDFMARVRRGEPVSFEIRICRPADGQIRWLHNRDFPIVDARGVAQRIGGIGQDVTALKSAIDHQKVLLEELQHRVRNALAVVRSVVRNTAEASETAEDFANHLEARIGALARLEVSLARNPMAGLDLAELIAEELRVCAAREGEQVTLDGPRVVLEAKAAGCVGLAIQELATNALKHGALLVREGLIRVAWRTQVRAARTWLIIDWTESGVANHPTAPRKAGFGAVLLQRTLSYDLGAEVVWRVETSGVRCQIAFPLVERPASSGRLARSESRGP